jgi:hypothetical protein
MFSISEVQISTAWIIEDLERGCEGIIHASDVHTPSFF